MDRWQEISRLYHAVRDYAVEKRAAFLSQECQGDDALRREVESLLRNEKDADNFLTRLAVEIAADMAIQAQQPSTAGRRLGPYEILSSIGAGGMGEVYRARDTRLKRPVAIKILSPEFSRDPDRKSRFEREAEAIAALNHPNICVIHDVGHQDGVDYLVMECLEGETLRERLARRLPIALDEARQIAIEISGALSQAHQRGIVHRDIKPGNIMLTKLGAKLLDFGLAKVIRSEDLKTGNFETATGVVLGTAAYMSPEQLLGLTIDPRSDVFSLGVVFYEMVTGTKPFQGANVIDTIDAILHKQPEPITRGATLVPPDVQQIIFKCLEKERDDRYESAEELLTALNAGNTHPTGFELNGAILHEDPAPLPPEIAGALQTSEISGALQTIDQGGLPKDPAERYQRAADVQAELESAQSRKSSFSWRVAAAIIAVVGVALTVAFLWKSLRPVQVPIAIGASGRPAIAVMRFENVGGAQSEDIRWLSDGVPSMLLTGLAQTQGLDIVSARQLLDTLKQTGGTSLAALDRSQAAEIARRAGAGAVVMGSIFRSGNEIRIDAHVDDLSSGRVLVADSVRGTDVFALVDQLASRIRSGVGIPEPATIARVSDISTSSLEAYRLYSEATTAYNNTRTMEARELFKQAVVIDPTFADAYVRLFITSHNLGMLDERDIYAAKAAEHADRLSERQRLLVRVEQARYAGNYAEVVRGLDELMAKYPDVVATYSIAYLIYQPVIGSLHDPGKLHTVFEAGVSALPNSTYVRNLYGYVLLFEGRFADAVRAFQTCAEIAPREPNPHDSLGEAHLLMGLPEKAIEHYSRSLTIDPEFLLSHTGRAWARSMMGQYDEALAHQRSNSVVRAFALSRVGRHAEAEQLIESDIRDAEGNKAIHYQGALLLLSAALAIERGQTAVADDKVRRAEHLFAELPQVARRVYSVIAHTIGGLALVRAGQIDSARVRLGLQRQIVNRDVAPEYWWHKLLEGEIALAEGDPQRAAAAFSAGEPKGKMWFSLTPPHLSLLANNLVSRDGAARAAKMRGDVVAGIQAYRGLLSVGRDQRWTAMYEPRYVFEIAALLDRSGDKVGALREYEHFLALWRNADAHLRELAEARRAIARLRTDAER
jgi:serine/threonine protein kinase/tetratricopeptide (TPR) repeat protein/TolB-like protein